MSFMTPSPSWAWVLVSKHAQAKQPLSNQNSLQIMVNIPLRSGIINAFLELLILLVVAPVWSCALIKIINSFTFRNARKKGHGVRIGQEIPSLSNPFLLFKSYAAGNKLLLLGEILMAILVFWLELGVNGETSSVFNSETRFVLNGGRFPTVTPESDVSGLRMIEGLSTQSRTCFQQVERNTYELYGVSYTSQQNFERDISRKYGFNESLCLSPDNVEQWVGIRFVGDYDSIIREYDLNTKRFKKERIPDGLFEGHLSGSCEGSVYGRNTYTVLGKYEEGSRIMVTTAAEEDDVVELEIGGLVNLEEDDLDDYSIFGRDYGTSTCADLNYTHMTRREFGVTLTGINSRLDIKNLARTVIAYFGSQNNFGVYRPHNAVNMMVELFFSGDVESDEDTQQVIGQFEQTHMRVKKEERPITVVSSEALISTVAVVVAVFMGLLVNMFINNQGRDTNSVAWTLGVVRSHYENLGKCWNKTSDVTTYWVQVREGWSTHFGPEGYGDVAKPGDDVKNEDITGRDPFSEQSKGRSPS
ncbi:unnamed protein product [Agarophyton chilense]